MGVEVANAESATMKENEHRQESWAAKSSIHSQGNRSSGAGRYEIINSRNIRGIRREYFSRRAIQFARFLW
jgi:hypothetical protein